MHFTLPQVNICTKFTITLLTMVRFSKLKKLLNIENELYMNLVLFSTYNPPIENHKCVIFGTLTLKSQIASPGGAHLDLSGQAHTAHS